MRKLLLQLDSDRLPSVFDRVVAYDAAADEIGDDIRLKIGEGENEIGFQRQDFFNIGRSEGADARFFAPRNRRAHRIA